MNQLFYNLVFLEFSKYALFGFNSETRPFTYRAGRNTRDSITRSTRLVSSSARFDFVASQASILARFSNEPTRISS
jgi:hypothetical protein